MKSIIASHETYGKPKDVLKATEIDLPDLLPNQATIKLVRASINPSDLGMIAGTYGRLRNLPAIAGREGIGEIVAVAHNVDSSLIGKKVRIPEDVGVWQQFQNCNVDNLFILPSDLNDDMLAMAFINPPTALCVLEEFTNLKKGDWVIQNGSGSGLGYFMIQICKARGIKTINMLRNAKSKELSLKNIGADVIIDESEFSLDKIKELTGGQLPILGLNQIGGQSVSNMIKSMANAGTIVTVGGMVGDLVRFPTRFLIFNDLRLRGFWWDKWQRSHSKNEVDELFEKIFSMIRNGILKAPVDSIFSMSDLENAIARASENARDGKVLLKF